MKVLVAVGLNRLSSLHVPSRHMTLLTVSYFLSEILRIPDNGRNRNLEIFYSFFKKLTEIPPLNCKIYLENVLEKSLCKNFPTMLGSQELLFFRVSKTPLLSICGYIFLKKMNIGRKNTCSQ